MTRTRTLLAFACAALAAGGVAGPARTDGMRNRLSRRLSNRVDHLSNADALAGAQQLDGWAAWEAALAGLLAIPAASVADVEVKFRAIADAEGPEALNPGTVHSAGLGAIWADLRRLSQQSSVSA